MQVLYFASLREQLNIDVEEIDALPSSTTVRKLLEQLRGRSELWSNALNPEQILVAVNQELVTFDTQIDNSDEVAFFPPVTGG